MNEKLTSLCLRRINGNVTHDANMHIEKLITKSCRYLFAALLIFSSIKKQLQTVILFNSFFNGCFLLHKNYVQIVISHINCHKSQADIIAPVFSRPYRNKFVGNTFLSENSWNTCNQNLHIMTTNLRSHFNTVL